MKETDKYKGEEEEAKSELSSFMCFLEHLSTWLYFGLIMALHKSNNTFANKKLSTKLGH